MRKWTVTLICTKCGKTFEYNMNDAVMPEDRKVLEHPICRKCMTLEKLEKFFRRNSHE